jgi:hypothetical protein
MFCTPGLVWGCTEGVGSRFHVLRSPTLLRRYRGCRVQFSCFALSNSLSAVPRVWGAVFMFCAPRLILSGTERAGSRFHVLRSRTHFGLYRGCRVPFSSFALPESFRAVPRGVGSYFYVLRSRTHFGRYRGRRVPFLCFALMNSFSAVPRVWVAVFMF